MTRSTYLTVAIPYVNASPHLGYAYELVLADIHARAARLDGVPTRFLGGTDDHSLKNVLAAERAGRPTSEFVADNAGRFVELADSLDVGFDDFIHTSTDPRHQPAVARLWAAAESAGDLYRNRYSGDYCVGCEQFLSTGDLVDGRCPEHGDPVEHVDEENWFFRLSRHQDRLVDLLSSGELRVSPEPFRNEALAFVRSGLTDLSVSRSAGRARGWGIAVPGDPSQVVSVWFDALANYLSALDFGDPKGAATRTWWHETRSRTHVIGKGILRFHAVYWPAFLLSAGLPVPTHIRVHPYLSVDGRKLSKSSGHGLDPAAVIDEYGSDALRWWFARDVAELADTDFTADRLVARFDEDLAGGVGNVVSRIVAVAHRATGGRVPAADGGIVGGLDGLAKEVRDAIADFRLREATARIVEAVGRLNRDLEATQPWKLVGVEEREDELAALLARHVVSARAIVDALDPIVPGIAARLRCRLTGSPLPPPSPAVARIR